MKEIEREKPEIIIRNYQSERKHPDIRIKGFQRERGS